MTTLDLLILAGLGLGAARGFSTGALRQVASLAGLVVSFLLSLQLMQPVGQLVVQSLRLSESVAPVVGFIVVFLLVQAVAFGLVRLGEGLLKALRLSVVNRLAGGAVGAFKAALLLSVLFLVLGTFDTPAPQTREDAQLYAPVAAALPTAWSFVADKWPEVQELSEKFEAPLERLPGS